MRWPHPGLGSAFLGVFSYFWMWPGLFGAGTVTWERGWRIAPGSSSPWGCSPHPVQSVIPSEIPGKRAVEALELPGAAGVAPPGASARSSPGAPPVPPRALSQTRLQTSALFEVCPSLLRSLPGISSTRQAGLFPN